MLPYTEKTKVLVHFVSMDNSVWKNNTYYLDYCSVVFSFGPLANWNFFSCKWNLVYLWHSSTENAVFSLKLYMLKQMMQIACTITWYRKLKSVLSVYIIITYSAIFTAKKDETGRVDRAQWKAMTSTMSDTTKFVDMLHNVPWEDGLPEDVLRGG